MTTTTIENKPTVTTTFDPWKKPTARPAYLDELLRPEHADRQLRLNEGSNWLRIVPAACSGSEAWMLGLHVLATPSGKFAHPRTFGNADSRCVWDASYGYLKKHDPGKLFCKANPDGLRLLPNPMSLCWVITGHGSDDTPLAVRLLMLSGYSGERGGTPGLGYQLYSMTQDRDEDGGLAHNILGEQDGVQINIEKIVSKESRYPRYILRAGRLPTPISDMLAKLPEDEAAVLQPLANVVRRMTEEEQWERLARLMPAPEVATIRAAIKK